VRFFGSKGQKHAADASSTEADLTRRNASIDRRVMSDRNAAARRAAPGRALPGGRAELVKKSYKTFFILS